MGGASFGEASFPSLAFAGRLTSDPLNQLSGETSLFAGTGSENVAFYLPPVGRGGDYSALTIEPATRGEANFCFSEIVF